MADYEFMLEKALLVTVLLISTALPSLCQEIPKGICKDVLATVKNAVGGTDMERQSADPDICYYRHDSSPGNSVTVEVVLIKTIAEGSKFKSFDKAASFLAKSAEWEEGRRQGKAVKRSSNYWDSFFEVKPRQGRIDTIYQMRKGKIVISLLSINRTLLDRLEASLRSVALKD